MSQPSEDQNDDVSEAGFAEIDFGAVEFPSDSLSIKRLRQSFPDHFENGMLVDGYGDFFHPSGAEDPKHLVRLNQLLSYERVLADYAFSNVIEPYTSEVADDESNWCYANAKEKLESLYREFKLADSPETARFLIQLVEEQGVEQAKRLLSRLR